MITGWYDAYHRQCWNPGARTKGGDHGIRPVRQWCGAAVPSAIAGRDVALASMRSCNSSRRCGPPGSGMCCSMAAARAAAHAVAKVCGASRATSCRCSPRRWRSERLAERTPTSRLQHQRADRFNQVSNWPRSGMSRQIGRGAWDSHVLTIVERTHKCSCRQTACSGPQTGHDPLLPSIDFLRS